MSPLPSRSTRLKPPASLSLAARTIFVSIVTDEPASHFKISDLPLLTAYFEASALAARAAHELQRDDVEAVWLTRWEKANRVLSAHSLRLRPSAAIAGAHTPKRPERVSYYDQMDLLDEEGADAPAGRQDCDWIEGTCRIPEGRYVGEHMVLLDFQRDLIDAIYNNAQAKDPTAPPARMIEDVLAEIDDHDTAALELAMDGARALGRGKQLDKMLETRS
jgi:hypothetical protein